MKARAKSAAIFLLALFSLTGCGAIAEAVRASKPAECYPQAIAQINQAKVDWPLWLDKSDTGASTAKAAKRIAYGLRLHRDSYSDSTDAHRALGAMLTMLNQQRAAIYSPYEAPSRDAITELQQQATDYAKAWVRFLSAQGCRAAPLPIFGARP